MYKYIVKTWAISNLLWELYVHLCSTNCVFHCVCRSITHSDDDSMNQLKHVRVCFQYIFNVFLVKSHYFKQINIFKLVYVLDFFVWNVYYYDIVISRALSVARHCAKWQQNASFGEWMNNQSPEIAYT